MAYKMTDEKWGAVMGLIRDSVKHPEKTPNDVLLLSLSNEELTQLFTKRRLELLNVIKKERPETMSVLAKTLNRELPAVERDLKILEELGIVNLEKTGREVRPVLEKEILILPLVEPLTLEKIKA